MKVNNIEVLNIWTIFSNKYQKTDNITVKWKIMEVAKEIFDIKSRFDIEKDNVVNKYGVENENNQKVLDVNDKHFQELLKCETSISPIPFKEISEIDFTLEEMMILKPIIEM